MVHPTRYGKQSNHMVKQAARAEYAGYVRQGDLWQVGRLIEHRHVANMETSICF